jgi:hypothetical protein
MSEQKIEFVDDLPPPGSQGRWVNRLLPLLDRPGVWALVNTCKNPKEAYKLQANLMSRQVFIPEPDHVWNFAARGCEVYGVYRGRKRGARK